MSWLEKIGLVEREEGLDLSEYEDTLVSDEPELEVDAEIETAANVVDEIYAQNNLAEKAKSIFTVKALIETLPAEMTTAKKQETVFGILNVNGDSISTLVDDATLRTEILNAAQKKIVGERIAEIEEAEKTIEDLKKAIEENNIRIKNAKDIISETEKSVEDEVKAIADLVEFCNGMEVK